MDEVQEESQKYTKKLKNDWFKAILGLIKLKQAKVYQEAQLEAKLEGITRMLDLGLSLEIITQSLGLPLDVVQGKVWKYR